MKLAWGNRVTPEFGRRVLAICDAFGWYDHHANWLMAAMYFETGGRFSPTVLNAAGSGAIGLIQFMPHTAEGLGTSTAQLASMTATQQLDFVEAYFKPYAHRINSLSDLYMAILLPRAIGKPEDAVLFSEGAAYRQNAALDANTDGKITKGEATVRVRTALDMGLRPENVAEVARPGATQPKEEPTMDPLSTSILTTAIPALWNAIPEIASIFKKPDVAARNVEAVQKVGQILIDSTQSANAQEAVTKVQSDPAMAAVANNAVRLSRADIMDMIERTAAIDEKSVGSAREFYSTDPFVIDTKAVRFKFAHILALLIVAVTSVLSYFVMKQPATSANMAERIMVLNTWFVIGLAGVIYFWYGTSRGSQIKDELRNRQ